MEPKHIRFGGGPPESIFNPAVLVVVLIAGILLLLLPRTKAIIPFLFAAILVPYDQIVVLGSIHLPMLRILLFFGFARIAWTKLSGKGQIFSGGLNGLDKTVIFLCVFVAVDSVLLWQEFSVVIYQLGVLDTCLGSYIVLRFLIRDEEGVKRALRTLACVTIVVAGIMTYEAMTGRNLLYTSLGGMHADIMQHALTRNDHIRAAGAFGHPILAGSFGGFMFPLFVGLASMEKKGRKFMVLGAIGAAVMGITANSSTALLGLLAGIGGFCFWPLRRNMRLIRWGIVTTLAGGQLYMKSPVWHIISDVDLAGGSDSYHRYQLVDQCIRHFTSWALVGTKDYASWGWDLWDLSNQYVLTADTAGLIPFALFLTAIVLGFKYVGRMRRSADAAGDRKQEIFVWAFGASLFANVVAFFGIDYFDQTIVAWYALLAMITTVTLPIRMAEPERKAALKFVPDFAFRPALASGPMRSLQSDGSEKEDGNAKTGLSVRNIR